MAATNPPLSPFWTTTREEREAQALTAALRLQIGSRVPSHLLPALAEELLPWSGTMASLQASFVEDVLKTVFKSSGVVLKSNTSTMSVVCSFAA